MSESGCIGFLNLNEKMKVEKLEREIGEQSDMKKLANLNSNLKRKFEEEQNKLEGNSQAKKQKFLAHGVPNWLIEVLEWIRRTELAASSLSTSCWIFKELSWPKLHGKVKARCVPKLEFRTERDEFGGNLSAKLIQRRGRNIPIAGVPPPEYIEGFNKIKIKFLDGQIIKFIESICPKLDGICLIFDIKIPLFCISNEKIRQINRLLEMLAKRTFTLANSCFFDYLRFYPNANAVFENVQSILTKVEKCEINLLIEWLNKPRLDQKPKLLRFIFRGEDPKFALIEKIKKHFFGCCTESANFLVRFDSLPDFPNFDEENEKTCERLTLYQNGNSAEFTKARQFLVRYPKNREHLKADWEREIHRKDMQILWVEIGEIGEF